MKNKASGAGMFKSLMAMQQRVTALQQEISKMEFDGVAANGLVSVKVNGNGELLRVTIDPQTMTEDADVVADLVVVASRHAHAAKEAAVKQKTASLGQGLMPLGLKIPGLA